jgi:hypothetical protein
LVLLFEEEVSVSESEVLPPLVRELVVALERLASLWAKPVSSVLLFGEEVSVSESEVLPPLVCLSGEIGLVLL